MARRIEKNLFVNSLKNSNLISESKIKEVLHIHKRTGHSIGYILVESGYLTQKQLVEFMEKKLSIPYANFTNYVIDPNVVRLIPENISKMYKLICILKVKNTISVAMVDPLDTFVIDMLKETTTCDIKPLVSTMDEINEAIEKYYSDDIFDNVLVNDKNAGLKELQKLSDNMQGIKFGDRTDLSSDSEDESAPTIKLVNMILTNAIESGASDIHIEPDEKVLRVRYRVDGMLQEVMSLSTQLESAIISRTKVMAELDIAEKRVPQDGRVNLKVEGKTIELRVSTFPTVHGEKIVLRILDKSSVLVRLEELGFSTDVLKVFGKAIRKPNGIILITGPTGSGKSTTLYAALDKINSVEKNIVTIEDPVEYQLPMINQAQVNLKAGFTFTSGLRHILRQDPNVVMVGEIRDYQTAEIAIRAALTGHLVFSTLHTNDAPGGFTRLIDMGVEPFLVASSVICIMAQRLVRLICPKCREKANIKQTYIEQICKITGFKDPSSITLYKGKGCKFCKDTGHTGRTTINEIVVPDEKIRELIVYKSPTSVIKKSARKSGMRTLREDGFSKVIKGITTVEEIMRVAQSDD